MFLGSSLLRCLCYLTSWCHIVIMFAHLFSLRPPAGIRPGSGPQLTAVQKEVLMTSLLFDSVFKWILCKARVSSISSSASIKNFQYKGMSSMITFLGDARHRKVCNGMAADQPGGIAFLLQLPFCVSSAGRVAGFRLSFSECSSIRQCRFLAHN